MTHHRHRHKHEDVGTHDTDRGYAWILAAVLGAVGVWLVVFSLSGKPLPAPTVQLPPIVVVEPAPAIESPVNEPELPQIEPPSLPPADIAKPELTEHRTGKPHRRHWVKHHAAAPVVAPYDPSQDPSRYAYWLHIQ
jgi:hypothetical protein